MLTDPGQYFGTAPDWGDKAEFLADKGTNMSSSPLSSLAKPKGYKGALHRSLWQISASRAYIMILQIVQDSLLNTEYSIPEKLILKGHNNKL